MQVLKGDEDLLLISNGTLAPFWHAIDIVKKRGYSLEHFRTWCRKSSESD